MSKDCRSCKHSADLHVNNKCGYDRCHCGYLLLDSGKEVVSYSSYDSEYNSWKKSRSGFNPSAKKMDRTARKKENYE